MVLGNRLNSYCIRERSNSFEGPIENPQLPTKEIYQRLKIGKIREQKPPAGIIVEYLYV